MKISHFIYITIGIAALLIAAANLLSGNYSMAGMAAAILLTLSVTIIAYILTFKGLDRKDSGGFTTFLMMGMFCKMIVGLVSVLIVALQFKFMLKEYVFSFFISYFIFTGFEVYGLMRKLRA